MMGIQVVYFLAITNKDATRICSQVLVRHVFSFLLGKPLGAEWLYHTVGVCLTN